MKIKDLLSKIRKSSDYQGFLACENILTTKIKADILLSDYEIKSLAQRFNKIQLLIDKAKEKFIDHITKRSKPIIITDQWLEKKSIELDKIIGDAIEKHLSEWASTYSVLKKLQKQEETTMARNC